MERIVVGVDGSASSQHALQWAGDEARRRGAQLVVVHAWTVPPLAYGSSVIPFTLEQDRLAFAKSASALVDRMVEAADLDGVDVEVRLVPEAAGRALVDASADADMIVVGSTGRSALRQMLVGSTARYVRRHTSTPMVVIPHEAEARQAA